MSIARDIQHMRHALRLAERALGTTAPNPAVGCVIADSEGHVAGRGWTQKGGRPHAEMIALQAAGARAKGATAYVSLEPCAHHGQTPPCAEALAAAGVARVVAAVKDPDPRVNGAGLEYLRKAGIAVAADLLAADAAELNRGFFLRVTANRPLVALKIAQSLDGRIAASSGESRWITGSAARRYGHFLRARHDAILVGIGTALADDPMLTCRLPGYEDRSPLRVVLDSALRLGEQSNLAQTAREYPTIAYTTQAKSGPLSASGVEIAAVPKDERGRTNLGAVLNDLAKRGITRLLVEGGARVHAAFLDGGFADRLEIFHAPLLLGGAGRTAIDVLAELGLGRAPRFHRTGRRTFGADTLESFAAGA
ncbi:MAG TPA: bifunctional diaminohydroxyphosphoribosylaminopyrimidine deaminase/5-amino-6-(5-phosphoribosylamino)uracil reductase RibD [Rhizomicrobium sp.]|nr:bifunctional diaminohydroxyphosphoribosylaminopyrimidine deaminase/5-amino-6-(5-phosphoribosylamino)uracil reductase RibD [Rhizomicrobium sp.]